MKNIFTTILEQSLIDEIIWAASDLDEKAWFLGDSVLLAHYKLQAVKSSIVTSPGLYPEKVENRILAVGFSDVIVFVADISGMSQITIRRYADLAKFYHPDVRGKYEMLPMSHYEWAKQFPDYAEDILDVDLKLVDTNGGTPVPLRVMQALFRSVDKIPEMLDQINRLDEMENVLALTEYEQPRDKGKDNIPPLVYHFLKNYTRIAEYLINAVDRWPISTEKKRAIIETVNRLYDLIGDSMEIMEDIDREVKVR